LDLIKKHFIGICIKIFLIFCTFVLMLILLYCIDNGWAYYYFDVLAKLSPAVAGFAAYYMWSKNREKEIKDLEYRHDYYKKILEKRMKAYEAIEKTDTPFLRNLSINSAKYHSCFRNKIETSKARSALREALDHAIWINTPILNELRNLNNCVREVAKYSDDNKRRLVAIKYYREIRGLHFKIRKLLARDMLDLDNIEMFLRKKYIRDDKITNFNKLKDKINSFISSK